MSTENNQLATQKPRASQTLALLMGMEPAAMLDTIKAQCFKGDPARITDAQLAAFVSIAAEMGVNPLLPGMLFAFPVQGGGIVPMMGPDGVYKKLTENPSVESWETIVYPEDVSLPPTHAVTKIYRKGVERPLSYTALLSEWKVNQNPNWNSRPRHMLSLRSLKQAARMVIHGIPFDDDERVIMGAIDVTGTGDQPTPPRPPPRPRAAKGANAIDATAIDLPKTVTAVAVEPAPAAPEPAKDSHPDLEAAKPAPITPAAPPAMSALADGEKLECEATVVSSSAKHLKQKDPALPPVPVAFLIVKGGFNGEVRVKNGADDALVLRPEFAAGKGLKLALEGKNGKAWASEATEVQEEF